MPNRPILCVDDEPANLALLRRILQDDHRLTFARSGQEALDAVQKNLPSMILLDVDMPDMTGLEVCRRLKARSETEDVPIIFVTGMSDIASERTGLEAGAVDYISKPISPPIVRARVRTHLSLVRAATLERSYHDAIHMLGAAGHYNDTDTGVHIWRMAAYSRCLAVATGWHDERATLLELAAPMHDTGKIGIPDAILKKPGKLDAEEWKVMRTHSRIGYDILRKSDAPIFQLAAEVALSHHERWDGTGYPDGLAGEAIPESARIVAIADVFDALSMKRPYKDAWPLDRVLATLEESAGSHLEKRLVDAFKSALPRVLELKAFWDAKEG